MEKKKLCLVIPTLQAGGMERVMSELAWYFSGKNQLETHMVLYGRNPEVFYKIPGNIMIHKPLSGFNNNLRFISTLGRLWYLRKKVKEINPATVLSFGEFWNSFVMIALMGLSYPVYISDRCSPERYYSRVHRVLRRFLYPRAAGIIAQTSKAKEIYAARFRHDNIKVIGNPIREIKDDKESSKEDVVLMVGRLIKSKHQDELIELFLKINIPGWKLVLVGYDHLQQNNSERLLEIIRKNNAQDKVLLEGKQSDVDRYYRKSRIFAFTSSSEGFPNAIGEAMSAGLPVVAFDCIAGPSEMITDQKNGFLVPVFDFEHFRTKLEILMKDRGLQKKMGDQAKKDISKFYIHHIGEEFYSFLVT